MLSPDEQLRLPEVFFPFAIRKEREVTKKGTRFVHYISAEVACSILREREIWMPARRSHGRRSKFLCEVRPAVPDQPALQCAALAMGGDDYLLGSYRIATAPEPNSSRLTSFKSKCFDSPANSVGPWPASLGCTTNSYSSINPSSANASGSFTPPTNSPLPDTRLSS